MNLVYIDALFRHFLWTGDVTLRGQSGRLLSATWPGAARIPPAFGLISYRCMTLMRPSGPAMIWSTRAAA